MAALQPTQDRVKRRPPRRRLENYQPLREEQPQRLQKILSRAGISSRRTAEELIREGRVQVNGQVVTQLGVKADPRKDRIAIDGRVLRVADEPVYILLHKPVGVVTTLSDPEGR